MAEKEAVLDAKEDQDLHSIETLMKQHEALEVMQLLCFEKHIFKIFLSN